MRLSCQKWFLIALALTTGCHDTIAPPPSTPRAGLYVLESVNGQPVPASLGGGTSVLWATLTLDVTGTAIRVNHTKSVFQNSSSENTYSIRAEYRVRGDSIEIGFFKPCPPGVLCIGNTLGMIADSSVALTVGYNPYPTNPIIYLYRLIQSY
jgi:hypothetical protein